MIIVDKIIQDISRLLILDVEDQENFAFVMNRCKHEGKAGIDELTQLTNLHIPIVKIYATVLQSGELSASQIKEISVEDLTCMLGIFAQDLLLRVQTSKKAS